MTISNEDQLQLDKIVTASEKSFDFLGAIKHFKSIKDIKDENENNLWHLALD